MKRLLIVLTAMTVLLVPASLWAQDAPKAEVFGGFSILSFKESGSSTRLTPVGWQASVAGNLNDKFGIVGDFGGEYKDDPTNCPSCKFYSFLGGPRFSHRQDKATVFVHALYGGTRISGSGFSETDFTMAYGGGVDVKAGDSMSIRLVQFDWMPIRTSASTGTGKEWQNNVIRFGFGVVFHMK